MSVNPPPNPSTRPSLFRNWISLSGLTIMVASVFSFLLLFVLDTFSHFSNPYIGILTYLIAPIFSVMGFILFAIGAILWRRKVKKTDGQTPNPSGFVETQGSPDVVRFHCWKRCVSVGDCGR